jgi:hypothetical protein
MVRSRGRPTPKTGAEAWRRSHRGHGADCRKQERRSYEESKKFWRASARQKKGCCWFCYNVWLAISRENRSVESISGYRGRAAYTAVKYPESADRQCASRPRRITSSREGVNLGSDQSPSPVAPALQPLRKVADQAHDLIEPFNQSRAASRNVTTRTRSATPRSYF